MHKSFSIPPEQYARDLLHTMKIDDIPIPIEEIAASLGIEIHYSEHMDAEAFLLHSGDKISNLKECADKDDCDRLNVLWHQQ